MKTAMSVLQELTTKFNTVPEYECIGQAGSCHMLSFHYRCAALGDMVTATAFSKKKAKQKAAWLMLQQLAEQGYDVPPPYVRAAGARKVPPYKSSVGAAAAAPSTQASGASAGAGAGDSRSYIDLLKTLCEEYGLPAVVYEQVVDSSPPYLSYMTCKMRGRQGYRIGNATTKDQAAKKLYSFLRENVVNVGDEFNTMQAAVTKALKTARANYPERALASVAAALELTVEPFGGGIALMGLTTTSPKLVFTGDGPRDAAEAALRYLQSTLA